MDRQRHENQTSSAAVWLLALLLVLLPVGYVLSIGPVAAIYENEEPPHAVMMFYMPIIWLSDACKPIGNCLEWYIRLWIDSP